MTPSTGNPSLLSDFTPEIASGVLTTSLIVMMAAIAILVVVMVWAHVARVTRRSRVERILAPLRPRLLALAAEEDPADPDPGRLSRSRSRVVDVAVLDLLGKVRGGAATALVDVLDGHGTVRGALRGTRSLSPTTRARSAQVLGATRRTEHSPTLAALLADRDRAVRSTAARALGVIGDATYADATLRAVRERQGLPGIPFYVAADALLAMGDDVREAVRRGLDDPDAGVRHVATTVAARGGMASLMPRILQLLRSDGEPRVRAAAAATLGVVGDARVLADLTSALGPSEPSTVRLAAARSLGELGSARAVPALAALLTDADRRLAEVAADALAALGRPGHEVLIETLQSGSVPSEISLRAPQEVPREDLAALACLGAVTALGIRERREELYELAIQRRPDEEPAP